MKASLEWQLRLRPLPNDPGGPDHVQPMRRLLKAALRVFDPTGAVDKLPNLVPTTGGAEKTESRGKGTDDVSEPPYSGSVPGVVTGDIPSHRTASIRTSDSEYDGNGKVTQPAKRHGPALIRTGPRCSA